MFVVVFVVVFVAVVVAVVVAVFVVVAHLVKTVCQGASTEDLPKPVWPRTYQSRFGTSTYMCGETR